MCATCGCEDARGVSIVDLDAMPVTHDHVEEHGHAHAHPHDPERTDASANGDRLVVLEQQVLAKNDALAGRNRGWFAGRETWRSTWLARQVPARRRCWNAPSKNLRGQLRSACWKVTRRPLWMATASAPPVRRWCR